MRSHNFLKAFRLVTISLATLTMSALLSLAATHSHGHRHTAPQARHAATRRVRSVSTRPRTISYRYARTTPGRRRSFRRGGARRIACHRCYPGRSVAVLEPQVSSPEQALVPFKHLPNLPPLRGSRESLLRQNEVANSEGLSRIENSEQLVAMLASRQLVAIPASFQLNVDPRLQPTRRYCRPWTAHFLTDLSTQFFARFHAPLQVNSAVRTVDYQEHLLLVNGNAAAAEGATRSPHLTGAAVDLAKKDLSPAQVAWMRAYLLPLQNSGKLDVEEEFKQSCFHIAVYKSYLPEAGIRTPKPAPPLRSQRHRSSALLAVQLR